MTVAEAFRFIFSELRKNKIESAELESSWVIERITGFTALERVREPNAEITQEQKLKMDFFITRRVAGEPLAYILSEKEFYNRKFFVDKNVLVPRPETEHLVDAALKWAKSRRGPLRILDYGTGSGCIGLTLLKEITNSTLVAVDSSKEAIVVAGENARRLAVDFRTRFVDRPVEELGDIGQFDIVVANPPYIAVNDLDVSENVLKFEPHAALFSGADGLAAMRNWLKTLPGRLKKECFVAFEIGASQGVEVSHLFRDLKTGDAALFSRHYILKDYAGHDRVVCGERE